MSSTYCQCSDSQLEISGALQSGSDYKCKACQRVIQIARIWGFNVTMAGSQATLKAKSEIERAANATQPTTSRSSNSSVAWVNHARRAGTAAAAVEGYVSFVSALTYVLCGGVAVLALANEVYQGILIAALLAAFQFITSASIRMFTSYIKFRTEFAIAEAQKG